MTVCVFCASSDLIASQYIELAADVGTEIARRGHTLVTGGGSVSCMGAVARAARAGGARTIGVIPRALLASEIADDNADELVVTEDMRTRKAVMDERADAFIALPGGLGTLEELLEIWVARTLRMHDKPIVVCDPDGAYRHLRAQVDQLVDTGFARAEVQHAVRWVDSAGAALDAVQAGVRRGPDQPPPTAREVLEAEP
ncbi:MAG: TIGR00730 family Rossman fold protein [Actinomycetes bacterium]